MDDLTKRARDLPTGRLGRFARMAALGARTGAGLVLGRNGDAIAERAAEVLGTMRGLAAKIGQMASYVDGLVPEAHREAFEGALGRLRAAAPISSPTAVRTLIEQELGAPIDRLFASFDEVPVASASIGQVHRARLEDGREVAVKVQHPGIDRAVAADLDNASVIEPLIRALGGRKLESARILAEVRERFEEELDYRHEAEQQRAFAAMFAGRREIVVPEVIAARSARRVLTSELVRGEPLEVAAGADEAERAAYARTLWTFTFDALLRHRRFNADPHPGNFLFLGEGRVAFLDFGCVQPVTPERSAHARAMHRAALARDEEAFREAAARMLGTRGGSYERLLLDYVRRCFEPLFASPFRFSRPYVVGIVEAIQAVKNEAFFAKDGSSVPLPAGMVFMNRLQFGFYSVLARLDCEVDYAEIERGILAAIA